jgi:flagellin
MDAETLGVASAEGFQQVLNVDGTVNGTVNGTNTSSLAVATGDTETTVTQLDSSVTINNTEYNYALKDGDNILAVSEDGKSYTFLESAVTDASSGTIDDTNNVTIGFDGNIVTSGTVTVSVTNGDADLTSADTVTAEASNSMIQFDTGTLDSGEYTVVDTTHSGVSSITGATHGLVDSDGNLVGVSTDSGEIYNSYEDSSKTLFDLSSTNTTLTSGTITVTGDGGIDVSTQEAASDAITTLNTAINDVSAERANLGSIQNRLDHTINNLSTTAENMTASESRIRDVDMAKEMMEYTKLGILQQASQAMLAQANQAPQGVLQLLQ